jgi:hypothetical protein
MVRIHVNMHVIRRNQKTGEREPPLTIIRGSKRERGHAVDIVGTARVVYRPDKPLSCGARVWIEADDATARLTQAQESEPWARSG